MCTLSGRALDAQPLDLEVNLRRCGLTTAQADQVRAEVKDSLWLAEQLRDAVVEALSKAAERARSFSHSAEDAVLEYRDAVESGASW